MGNRERASFVLKGKKNGIMVVICGSVHTLFFFSNAAAWGVMFQTLSLVLLSQAAEDTSRYLVKLNLEAGHSNEITTLITTQNGSAAALEKKNKV